MSTELSSLTDVANLALSEIGQKTINNINTDDDNTARTMKRWTERCIREVQVMINWHELYTGPKLLEFVTDNYAGVFGQYQYRLPADFLLVLETATLDINSLPAADIRTGVDLEWKLQNNFLIARYENFQMFYQRVELSPAKWSDEMTRLIYTYLASKVCFNVTNDKGLSQASKVQYQQVRAEVTAVSQNRARSFKGRPRGYSMTRAKGSSNPGSGRWG